jgi:hypothetical protein
MKHKDVLPAWAFHPPAKRVAPEKQSILKSQRHPRAFIRKATVLEFDLVEHVCQHVLVAMFESRVITLKEDTADIFQSVLHLRICMAEAAAGELNFPVVNSQEL